MLKISFEINGRPVSPGNVGDGLEAAIVEKLEQTIHSKLAGIRDPETGEFPTVAVRGASLENLSFVVSGSPSLIGIVKRRLGDDLGGTVKGENEGMNQNVTDPKTPPIAFLSYASENKALARRIAEDFQCQGIETFFDEWEIGPGDSIRAKIDAGLRNCTHFVVLLTPESIDKPWVNTKIDAAFVSKVERRCNFIPLRVDLPVDRLSPLLRSVRSPAIRDYDKDIREVIDWIHGVSKKPPLGEPPGAIARAVGKVGLSPAAETIVRLFVERTEHGRKFDPQIGPDDLRQSTKLGDDDILDAVDELKSKGLVGHSNTLTEDPLGFISPYSEAALFAGFDQYFKDWVPANDARLIAADLVNGNGEAQVPELAEKYGWPPRRINPAVEYLLERRLVQGHRALATGPWSLLFIRKNATTRRFVRDQ
jgi:hypothetical protein